MEPSQATHGSQGQLRGLQPDIVDRLGTVSMVSHVLNSSYDLHEVLRAVLEVVITVFSGQRGLVLLCSAEGKVEGKVALDVTQQPWADDFPFSSSLIDRVLLERTPLLVFDAMKDAKLDGSESVKIVGTRAVMCSPLISREQLRGLIYVDSLVSAGVFAQTDLQMLGIIADMIAVDVERTRNFSELMEKSVKLELTLDDLEMANRSLSQASEETVLRLSVAAETRHDETGAHIQRVAHYCEALAVRLGLPETFIANLKLASQMHDIGKLGVPDAILKKPGRYTPAEFEEMKKHTLIGARILAGSRSPVMRLAEAIALTHHERWDGNGYPRGLTGEGIPLPGRIVAVADAFDALTSVRCYKPPFPPEEAFAILIKDAGSHFDANLVSAFLDVQDTLLEIRERYQAYEPKTDPEAGVERLWDTFQEKVNGRLNLIERAVEGIRLGQLDDALREESRLSAHRLVGALGSFGFKSASELARDLERAFDPNTTAGPEFNPRNLTSIVAEIRKDLDRTSGSAGAVTTGEIATISTFLIVEDDPGQRAGMLAEASARGLKTLQAENTAIARQLMEQKAPDAVILDLGSAARSGIEFLGWLRETSPSLPVVVLGSSSSFDDRLTVARLGGAAFLQKPVPASHIFEEVLRRLEPTRGERGGVLVLDDDPVASSRIRHALADRNLAVTIATNPQQLWEHLSKEVPDLLLVDLDVAALGGQDICSVIRNDPQFANLPILVMTEHDDTRTLAAVLSAGADDFLRKPFSPTEMLSRVEIRLARQRLVESLSGTDLLTGLSNRRKATHTASQLLSLAARQSRPVVICLLDLDNFRRLNENFGQAAGDEVLKTLGGLLDATFRKEDIVARWGGEEFLAVLYGATLVDGRKRIIHVRDGLQSHRFEVGAADFTATFSAGLAQSPDHGTDLETLMRVAERALHVAKESGGDAVQTPQ